MTPEPSSETFNAILKDQKIESDRTNNAIVISKILNALHQHTDSVIDDVVQAEKYIHELEQEVSVCVCVCMYDILECVDSRL